jgi:two-component system sensor histidine kinase ChvG
MLSNFLKNLSILKKFLFINLIFFTIIGIFLFIYLKNVQPNLIKKKTSNHIEVINNTIDNLTRLNVEFVEDDIRKFLFSTRFLFQNLDRVIFFDNQLNLLGDTDTLDLDPRSFSQRLDTIQLEQIDQNNLKKKKIIKKSKNKNKLSLENILLSYYKSKEYGKPYTYVQENYNQFLLTTIKNININGNNVGFIMITENANDIKNAIDERKTFVIRTAVIVAIVVLIFSIILNRYFLKPIKNLVDYTKIVKEKSKKKTNINILKNRNDELGTLSTSLDDMTNNLQKRIQNAENFSTDLVHEIRNPLASLKSATEILNETTDKSERLKLLNILDHDIQRIERLITDYSQILKDEVALSKEKMNIIDLKSIVKSVVDDFNSIYETKRGIKVEFEDKGNLKEYTISGIENRIEQIIANLLDNSISFSSDNKKILVQIKKDNNQNILLKVVDEGQGFKEKDTDKIFKRFYSNRPEKFGEHSGLGLNIVKNLVDLHGGSIKASNNLNQKGANVEIIFPKS